MSVASAKRTAVARRSLVAAVGLFVASVIHPSAKADEATGVTIGYEQPKKASFKPLYVKLRRFRVLERMQEILADVNLPAPLRLRFSSCGSDDAYYAPENKSVTFCYELARELIDMAPRGRAPSGLSHDDAIVGAISIVLLHEIGHALFDLLKMPIFGREEDAADQIATFTLLHLGSHDAQRFVNGAAFMLFSLSRQEQSDKGTMADEHPLSAQRFYNTLCIAYGSDPKRYAYLVRRHYLPHDRAEGCEGEYAQVKYAFAKLVAPSIKSPEAREHLEKAFHDNN